MRGEGEVCACGAAIFMPCGKSDIPAMPDRYCASRSDMFASQTLF